MTLACFYNMNIDINGAFNPDWKVPLVDRARVFTYDPEEVFKRSFLDTMEHHDLPVRWILGFGRPAWFMHQHAHVDVYKTIGIDSMGLNIVIGGRHSTMRWYRSPPSFSDPASYPRSYTESGVPYIQFEIGGLEEIQRAELGFQLTMVRTDIPHAIFCGAQPRFCVSMRGDRDVSLTWNHQVQRMMDRGLIDQVI